MNKKTRLCGIAAVIATFAVMAYLMGHYSDFIYKFAALSSFDCSWNWFAGLWDRPGALLLWCGRFLTQLCFHPWVAIAALLTVFALVVLLTGVLFVRDRRFRTLGLLPVVAVLLFLMRLGFRVYLLKNDSLIFTQPLGLLLSLTVVWILSRVTSHRGAALCVAGMLAYPALGFYGLFAMLLYGAFAAVRLEGRDRLLLPLASLCLVAALPWLCYKLCFSGCDIRNMWLIGLPYLDFELTSAKMLPLAAALVLLLVIAMIPWKDDCGRRSWPALVTAAIVAALSISALYLLPCRDALLHRQLKAERALERGDWDTVLRCANASQVTGEVLVAYRNAALFRKGLLVEKGFGYSFSTVPVKDGDQALPVSRVAGPTMYYYSGLLNFAARWCFELNLGASYATERLKYLAKIALICDEPELASKYISAVGRNPFQKSWARKYAACLEDPSLLADDPDYRAYKPMREYVQESWLPSESASEHIPQFYILASDVCPSREYTDWAMAMCMIFRTDSNFENLYANYAASHGSVPEEVQMARVIFAYESQDSERIRMANSALGEDSPVVAEFNDYMLRKLTSPDGEARGNHYLNYFYKPAK